MSPSRKHLMDLASNKELVARARGLAHNSSGIAESLLAGCVEHERKQRTAKTAMLEATIATWNDFNTKRGSYADEYSPL
jgi:antitoxin CcdA